MQIPQFGELFLQRIVEQGSQSCASCGRTKEWRSINTCREVEAVQCELDYLAEEIGGAEPTTKSASFGCSPSLAGSSARLHKYPLGLGSQARMAPTRRTADEQSGSPVSKQDSVFSVILPDLPCLQRIAQRSRCRTTSPVRRGADGAQRSELRIEVVVELGEERAESIFGAVARI